MHCTNIKLSNNMKILFYTVAMLIGLWSCSEKTENSFQITVTNPTAMVRYNEPVEIKLSKLNLSAEQLQGVFYLICDGEVCSFQIDDFDKDSTPDEFSFLCNLNANESKKYYLKVIQFEVQEQISFEDKTWAQLMLKEDMKLQDSLTAQGGNLYKQCYHHGPAFENREIAYRIYFDRRMSIDVYGKKQDKLELKQTHWYSDSIQRQNGFGKDILWVGKTVSLGAVRGWNGQKTLFAKDVESRTAKVIAHGPIRTIVEMETEGWKYESKVVDMTSKFTLYAGHHDFEHELSISQNSIALCTGLMKKDSAVYIHGNGYDGLWGFNLAESGDAIADTFGLGVVIPEKYIAKKAEDELNHLHLLNTNKHQVFKWYGVAFWEQEQEGINNKNDFFTYLNELKYRIDNPVEVKIN